MSMHSPGGRYCGRYAQLSNGGGGGAAGAPAGRNAIPKGDACEPRPRQRSSKRVGLVVSEAASTTSEIQSSSMKALRKKKRRQVVPCPGCTLGEPSVRPARESASASAAPPTEQQRNTWSRA